jgi:protein O-GlcNAc transferase
LVLAEARTEVNIDVDVELDAAREPAYLAERVSRARACVLRGQHPAAERLYHEVLGRRPEHVEALEGLGLCALSARRPREAIDWLERARAVSPQSARVIGNLGLALRHDGQRARALQCYEQALALDPNDPGLLINRGRALRDAGQLAAAVASFRQAVACEPGSAGSWSMLSNALREAGELDAALEAARRALALDARSFEAHLNEGAALHRLGRFESAAGSYIVAATAASTRPAALANLAAGLGNAAFRQALGRGPLLTLALRLQGAAGVARAEAAPAPFAAQDAAPLLELGRLERDAQRTATAIVCFEAALRLSPAAGGQRELGLLLWDRGHEAAALDQLFAAIARDPSDPQNHRLLGAWLSTRGKLERSDPRFARALERCPEDIEALLRLGVAAQRIGRASEATALYERLVRTSPELPDAHFYLGSALGKQGRHREAVVAYRRALALDPSRLVAFSNALFALHFDPSVSREALFDEHRAFGRALQGQVGAASAPQAAGKERAPRPIPAAREAQRRLRIGYVSPDLCAHAVSHFIEPVLENHDPEAVEVYCYSDAARPDAVSERLARLVPSFTACRGWSHDALYERIVQDRIDILIDLAGHTGKNRLAVFAREPSPVQVSWIGYFDTTGLEAIDYRIADEHSVPPGEERFFVEQVVRLPRSQNCYKPPPAPEPGPPPCLERGFVTFGYFNNPSKLGRHVVAAFGRILRALPDSRLLLKYRAFDEPGMSARYLGWLAEEGIAQERIQIEGHGSMERYLGAVAGVDIALDPFPYSGETTALHGLWMGVPVVTLEGSSVVQRLASRVLRVCALNDWIAGSVDEYVSIALALATSPAELARQRAALRARLAASPICDARGVTRELEALYRRMWRRACGELQALDASSASAL